MPEARDGFQEYGTFSEPNGVLDALAVVAFDPSEELLWTGTHTGRIVGYHAESMHKYTSWKAHNDEVRQFLLNEQGITSISANNIRFYSREGKLQLSYSQEELEEIICGMWTTASQTTFLLGNRRSPSAHIFDLRRGRVVKEVTMDSCVTTMARNSRQFCLGHSDGSISVRDPRSLRAEANLKPHQTHVMALDVKGDLMVSCGYIQRGPRTILENQLRVYDLRMMRMMQSIRFDEGAFFLKFHPSLTSTIAAASPSGSNIQILDVSQNGGHVSHQWYIESPSQEIFSADFASTGECLAFGDADGYVHLWSAVNARSHARVFNVNLFSQNKIAKVEDTRPPKPSAPVGDSLLSLPWISTLLQATDTQSIFNPIDESTTTGNATTNTHGNNGSQTLQGLVAPRTPEKGAGRGGLRSSTGLSSTASADASQPPSSSSASTSSSLLIPVQPVAMRADSSGKKSIDDLHSKTPIESSRTPESSSTMMRSPNEPSTMKFPNDSSSRPTTPPSRSETPKTPLNSSDTSHLSNKRHTGGNVSSEWNISRFSREQPLSALDEHLFLASKIPQPIDPELLKFMRVSAGIGVIATEPGTRKRNLARDAFRDSLQELKADLSSQFEEAYEDTLPPGTPLRSSSSVTKSKAPRPFRLIPAHHPSGRFGHFDYSQYNHTDHVGLEHMGPVSSRCNPIIQLLYAIPQIRVSMRNHLCAAEHCVMCELGFLFHMMELQSLEPEGEEASRTCSPKNLLLCLRALPKVASSGLFLLEYESLPSLVERFNRFLLSQLHDEWAHNKPIGDQPVPKCAVEGMLGANIISLRHCASCGSNTSSHATSFTFKLKCPLDQGEFNGLNGGKRTTFASMFASILTQNNQSHNYCDHCKTFQLMTVTQEVESIPPQLSISCDMSGEGGEEAFWSSVSDDYTPARSSSVDHWIPFFLLVTKEEESITTGNERASGTTSSISTSSSESPSTSSSTPKSTSRWVVQEFDKLPPHLSNDSRIYELSAVVSSIKDDDMQHMIGQIRTAPDQWHLFNDFHVAPCGRLDAVHISSDWKIPSLIHYRRRDAEEVFPSPAYVNPITSKCFCEMATPCEDPIVSEAQLAELENELAIDAEFVLLKEEQSEDSHGGLKRIISPNEFGVARVSLLGTTIATGSEKCVMDDYVSINSSDIINYLTQYSGINVGDLDRKTSKHHVLSLKAAYLKLRYIVDSGRILVGHGLTKDFSTINIVVPSSQVIDTVNLFHLENQRMISLRFLANVLLGLDIQQSTHDSIEDSRTALQLYRRYQELTAQGTFDEVLQEIYAIGRKRLWKVYSGDRAGVNITPKPSSSEEVVTKP